MASLTESERRRWHRLGQVLQGLPPLDPPSIDVLEKKLDRLIAAIESGSLASGRHVPTASGFPPPSAAGLRQPQPRPTPTGLEIVREGSPIKAPASISNVDPRATKGATTQPDFRDKPIIEPSTKPVARESLAKIPWGSSPELDPKQTEDRMKRKLPELTYTPGQIERAQSATKFFSELHWYGNELGGGP